MGSPTSPGCGAAQVMFEVLANPKALACNMACSRENGISAGVWFGMIIGDGVLSYLGADAIMLGEIAEVLVVVV